MIRKQLLCTSCFEKEAEYLRFFVYREKSGDYSLRSPSLLCRKCRNDFVANTDREFEGLPRIYSFLEMATMPMGSLMFLHSMRGKVYNDMAEPVWKKRLFQIKKIYEGRIASWTNKYPMPPI